jgi:hypothetical protein
MINMKAVYLDDGLHRRIKLLATREGKPLKSVVQSLLEQSLSESSPIAEVSTAELQILASRGRSFDFLDDAREEVYSLDDGEPVE